MRKIKAYHLFISILLFMILGKTTSVNADETETNINGVSQGQMSVTGTLGTTETSEPEEVIPSEEKPEPIVPTKDSESNNEILNTYLPKTGESTNPFKELAGLLIIFMTGQLFIKMKKRKET